MTEIPKDGLFDEPEGATPLGPDEIVGLIPTYISNRNELNEAELDNITKALNWAYLQHGPWRLDALLTDRSMRDLHARMFGDVWSWAGSYRRRLTNPGVPPHEIPVRLHDLLGDVLFQTRDLSALPWPSDEVAVRFHHRLVVVHPFPNGNGRHARLAADLLVGLLGQRAFTWGGADLGDVGSARAAYLAALRVADATQEFGPLLAFARS